MDFISCEHITDKRLFHFKVNLHSLYAYECFYRISGYLDFSSLLSVYSLCLLFFLSLFSLFFLLSIFLKSLQVNNLSKEC